MANFGAVTYDNQNGQVSWYGVSFDAGDEFNKFLTIDVVSRLNDESESIEFEKHLRGLGNSKFAEENLNAILTARIQEERDWAVGEAMAEAFLSRKLNVIWPWNMKRDMRNPNASLPGADLIGFIKENDKIRLLFGEVKSSSQLTKPPSIMNGRGGMIHQIDNLANDLSIIGQLLSWLWFRCKGTKYKSLFDAAAELFLESGNKALALFGVLIRDTIPDERDLRSRGKALAKKLSFPTTCHLIAIYLPCAIDELPARVVS